MPKFLAHVGMVNVQATLQLVVTILISEFLTDLSQRVSLLEQRTWLPCNTMLTASRTAGYALE